MKIKFMTLISLLALSALMALAGCKGSSAAAATTTPPTSTTTPPTTIATPLTTTTTTAPKTTTTIPPTTTTATGPVTMTTSAIAKLYQVYYSDSSGFSPKTMTVPAGTKMEWDSPDDFEAQIVLADGTLIGSVPPRGSLTYVFTKAGTYNYHDGLNPTFTGVIIVT